MANDTTIIPSGIYKGCTLQHSITSKSKGGFYCMYMVLSNHMFTIDSWRASVKDPEAYVKEIVARCVKEPIE